MICSKQPSRVTSYCTVRIVGIALAVMLSAVLTGAAHEPGEKGPANLQVLDSTMSHDELMAIMSSYTEALRVGCDYCHVRTKASNNQDFNFASDSLKTKLAARDMIRMVSNINGTYITHLPTADTPRVMVQCITCHRGQPKPVLLADLLSRVRREQGLAAVDSVYRDLRQRYYGSATFDFSDASLVNFAFDVSEDSDSDALAILTLNEEFNPRSAFNEWAKGKIHLEMGDTTAAITDYKRALEIDPNYRRATQELEVLGVQKP